MFSSAKNFVVFEGIDGSGKTIQIELLKKYTKEKGIKDIVFTLEPTPFGQWSEKIKEITHGQPDKVSAKDLQLLYILDRKDHITEFIEPNLKEGKKIFCDRYFLSTLAYGSLDKNLHWKTLWNFHKEIIGDSFILPSKIIFFDVPAEIAVERIKNRGGKITIFESLDKLREIRENYLSIGKNFEEFEIVDSSKTPEEVFQTLLNSIKDIF